MANATEQNAVTKNTICWAELQTDDVEAAKRFYGSMFEWTFEVTELPGGMTYTTVVTPEGPKGGIMQKARPEVPVGWSNYISVEEHDSYLAKVVELGGKVLMPETQVPGAGSFSIIQDPTGGAIGLWKCAKAS